jgi:hypothetical protein
MAVEPDLTNWQILPRRTEPNYLYLMLGLFSAVVLGTAATPGSLLARASGLLAVLSLLVSAYFLIERRRYLFLTLLLGAAAFLPFAWLSTHREALAPHLATGLYVVNVVLWVLFLVAIGLLVLRGILMARHIRGNEIYGAISVYLLIGVLFAAVYQLLLAWEPGALYFDPARFPVPQQLTDGLDTRGVGVVLYYSFVTLGTVGYGDVTPASPVARAVSLIEAILGIMYVATLITRFVSIQISSESRGTEPARDEPSHGATAKGRHDPP